jgi:hypothetical protein
MLNNRILPWTLLAIFRLAEAKSWRDKDSGVESTKEASRDFRFPGSAGLLLFDEQIH